MRSPTRIEVFNGQSVISLPVRLHPAFIPHLVLIAVIFLASTADLVMTTVSWMTGV